MTDSWERRSVPYTRGYNMPRNPTFSVTYDSGTDVLTIETPGNNALSGVNEIVFEGSGGDGVLASGDFTVVSPTMITVAGACAKLACDSTLTQLDLYNPGPTLVGTWTGSVALSAGGASIVMDESDVITIYDPAADFTDADLVVSFGKTPYENYLPDFTVVDANTITLQWYPGGLPSSDYNTFIFGFAVFNTTIGDWPGSQIEQYVLSEPIDATSTDMAAISGFSSPAANRLQVDGVRFLTGSLEDLDKITTSLAGGRVYSNQAGPNAGDLSGGVTIVSWTDTQIIIEDSAISGSVLGVDNFIDYQGAFNQLHTYQANDNTLWPYAPFPSVTIL